MLINGFKDFFCQSFLEQGCKLVKNSVDNMKKVVRDKIIKELKKRKV